MAELDDEVRLVPESPVRERATERQAFELLAIFLHEAIIAIRITIVLTFCMIRIVLTTIITTVIINTVSVAFIFCC